MIATFVCIPSKLHWSKDRIPNDRGERPGFEVRFDCEACPRRVWFRVEVSQLADRATGRSPTRCKCGGGWRMGRAIRRVTVPLDPATKQPFRAQPASTRE